jgi:hypothetical protein
MYKMATKTHGLIDYVAGAAFIALPKALNMTGPAAYLLHGAGTGALLYSFFTNYERGVVRALPMKAHLALDALSGGMLVGAAAMLDDEEDEDRAALLAAVGVFEIVAALTTETKSTTELRDEVYERNMQSQRPATYPTYPASYPTPPEQGPDAHVESDSATPEASVPT